MARNPATLQVDIRADASITLGTGHVARCATLADRLRERSGARPRFICRETDGHLLAWLAGQGYDTVALPAGIPAAEDARRCGELVAKRSPDWVIVDHYALDSSWERIVRHSAPGARILAIDDLADRAHDADALLDQNFYPSLERRYDALVPPGCNQLLGPRFALLRPEFARERTGLRAREGRLATVLIAFGGSDPGNLTERVIRTLRAAAPTIAADVVVGASNPHAARVAELCASLPGYAFSQGVADMAARMARADLSIGAGGSMTWERCSLGLPAIVSILAPNQDALTAGIEARGAALSIGTPDAGHQSRLEAALRALTPARLAALSAVGLELVDARGADRVADAMLLDA